MYRSGNDINILFGKNLKRIRTQRNISQLTLANMADLTHNFINEIENGRKWISPETLAKLSNALEIEPYQFFTPSSTSLGIKAEFMTSYLDDIQDSFNKMVQELRVRYLPDENM
ncbi:MAG: helix-turn-helix domain-containing protein [Treponema sp.]|jgi:transcriptional regulator with XRE-family HTH domain|nr:helix-turn-helix domain-containing protein [Treponema sp.]